MLRCFCVAIQINEEQKLYFIKTFGCTRFVI
ncbi:hypothetical protein C7M60_04185 [Clostridium botulinum]|nr:hypothetical protein C7M60_04185 [Clostridium botulinum]AVQ49095.1 hypothetical protein C7M58_06995 [Clostridium botulinum]